MADLVFENLSTRDLTAVVRSGETLQRPVALGELIARGQARPALLTEVAVDAAQPADVRTTAIVALAAKDRAPVRTTLRGLVADADEGVARRAILAIGRVGREDDLGALEALQVVDGMVADAARFSRALISYRLGLDRHLFRVPTADELLVRARGAGALEPSVPRPPVLERAVADAAPDLPALPVAAATAVRLPCPDADHIVLLSEDARRALRAVPSGPLVLAVVLRYTASAARWYLHEYVFAHPAKDGALDLVGTRSTGSIVHAGRLVPAGDGRAAVALRGVAGARRWATELAATVTLGREPRIVIDDAVSFAVDRPPLRRPTRASATVA